MTTREILSRFDGVKAYGDYWMACCPTHDDSTPSLQISQGDDGRTLLHDHGGCETETILAAKGLTMADLFAEKKTGPRYEFECAYDYRDERGQLLFQVLRKPGKKFIQRKPDGVGGWEYKLNGARRVPYRLPELLKADVAAPVFIPEGEKDVDRLISLGLVATCNPHGAGRWRKEYNELLRGRRIVILPDDDEPGRDHAAKVERSLNGSAASIKILPLEGLPPSGDVSDWLDAGHDAQELLKLAAELIVTESADKWTEPQQIPDGLLPVPRMDIALLPAAFRGWLHDIADRLQVPLEFPTMPAIVAVASVIGNQIGIRPKAHDDWAVTPNLWGAVVGRPGVMKSPAIAEAVKPLRRLCAEAAKRYEDALKAWKFEKEAQKARQTATRKKMERAAKDGKDLSSYKDDWTSDEESEPTERRYIVNDSTVEKFGALLNQNANGLLLFRDELTGWFRALDDDRRANDRAFFLECWNGDGSYVYDRIERGTLKIDRATASVLGGIQPGPLQTYLRGALGCGEGDDGLLQRFQLMVFPDLPDDFKYVDRWPDSDAKNAAYKIFERLSEISIGGNVDVDGDGERYLRFSPEAQEFFVEWYSDLRREIRSGVYDHPAIEAHVAKYAKLMPALALIFELINAANTAFDAFVGTVSQESAEIAAAWCDFLLRHARRIYGLGLTATTTLAHNIAGHLQKGDLFEPFTPRDIYYRGWSGLTTADSVKDPLEMLEYLGWIKGGAITTGGRPTIQYKINPRISEVKL